MSQFKELYIHVVIKYLSIFAIFAWQCIHNVDNILLNKCTLYINTDLKYINLTQDVFYFSHKSIIYINKVRNRSARFIRVLLYVYDTCNDYTVLQQL